jgi:hypothetical protein
MIAADQGRSLRVTGTPGTAGTSAVRFFRKAAAVRVTSGYAGN